MLQEYYNAGSVGYTDLAATRTEMLGLQMDRIDLEAERALAIADLMLLTSMQIQIVK